MEIYRDGSALVLVGPLDARCTAEVRLALYDHLAAHEGTIAVDLAEVPWIDEAALNMLAMAAHHAEGERRHVVLRGCSRHLRRVLLHSRARVLLEVEHDTSTG